VNRGRPELETKPSIIKRINCFKQQNSEENPLIYLANNSSQTGIDRSKLSAYNAANINSLNNKTAANALGNNVNDSESIKNDSHSLSYQNKQPQSMSVINEEAKFQLQQIKQLQQLQSLQKMQQYLNTGQNPLTNNNSRNITNQNSFDMTDYEYANSQMMYNNANANNPNYNLFINPNMYNQPPYAHPVNSFF
jgi:hypothetical protein